MIKNEYVLVDRIFMLNVDGPDVSWEEEYEKMVEKVAPGLNVMIVHLAHDNAEMQAVAVNHPAFGATWREKNQIQLVTWKEIGVLK